ncbi:hypothetical protein COCNU_13G000390 [Cocos nucifera]|uniref:Uncharacterized protein n=1 Tax=Cocos nucifera TaxID=13894 RepID=A0A8K0ITU8_COCNU|nr:hypothetical protein COCNU_13G000390 [Cocos nucifera]
MKCPKLVLMISIVYLILKASPLLVSVKVGKYSSGSASKETPKERWRAVDSISFQYGKFGRGSNRREQGFQEEKRFSPTGSNPLHNL